MSRLTELQQKFQNLLLGKESDFKQDVVATKNLAVERRIEIYLDAYQSRLISALAANYPKLRLYLGFKQFNELALTYLERHPSENPSIRWFGDQLPEFLKSQTPYDQLPQLAELALFEWKMTLSFDAAEAAKVSESQVLAIDPQDWPGMKIHFHPGLQLLQLTYNVIDVWKSLDKDGVPPELKQNRVPQTWVIWRQDLLNQFCPVTEVESLAMQAVIAGKDFSDICEALSLNMEEDEAALRAASLLRGWVIAGIVSQVEI